MKAAVGAKLAKSERGALEKYDPQKGLKTIAVLEGIEKHFARAKDASKLQIAIRQKLEAQAEFVFWWDNNVEKNKGAEGVGKKVPLQVSNGTLKAGANGVPDRTTLHRWRTKLNDPDKFEATYEAALGRYRKLLEFDTTAHVGHNSGENEWYTPAEYIEAARAVLGAIDLDPATSEAANTVVKAAQIFTAKQSGLDQPWHGRVWMNPPYSQPLVQHFADKLATSVESGDVSAAVVLINNASETEFFQTLGRVAAAVCFPKGRIRFWSPKKDSATPLQGQALFYMGDKVPDFVEIFGTFGSVWVKP